MIEASLIDSFSREAVRAAVERGAHYLVDSKNPDGGVKFEDERSNRSGVWVTAEALEFFLTSNSVPITVFDEVHPMIDFILDSQNDDGSWSILAKDEEGVGGNEPSSIATGHCVYVLKMAHDDQYYDDARVRDAIRKGEAWLGKCHSERDGYVFWCTKPATGHPDPNSDEESRMTYVFSSYYAILGLVPRAGSPPKEPAGRLLNKAARFFEGQAEFFAQRYGKLGKSGADDAIQKICSTVCRIISVMHALGRPIDGEVNETLLSIVRGASPFSTSQIFMNDGASVSYNLSYNNNTPFDVANALLDMKVDAVTVKGIVGRYVQEQTTEGYWYLNFDRSFKRNTWPTAEALIVLEKALGLYDEIEEMEKRQLLDDLDRQYTGRIEELEKRAQEDARLASRRWRASAVVSLVACIAILCFCLYEISGLLDVIAAGGLDVPVNKYSVFLVSVIPLAISIILSAIVALMNRKPKAMSRRKEKGDNDGG